MSCWRNRKYFIERMHHNVQIGDAVSTETVGLSLLPVFRLLASPVHLRPSPIHPGAQSHLKLPAVLVQVACLWQLWAPISHSLISNKEKKNRLEMTLKQTLYWRFNELGLFPGGASLASESELMRGLNCFKTTAGDDRAKSFWVTVFTRGELYFRAEATETFSWFLILIAFLQRFNEQSQSPVFFFF